MLVELLQPCPIRKSISGYKEHSRLRYLPGELAGERYFRLLSARDRIELQKADRACNQVFRDLMESFYEGMDGETIDMEDALYGPSPEEVWNNPVFQELFFLSLPEEVTPYHPSIRGMTYHSDPKMVRVDYVFDTEDPELSEECARLTEEMLDVIWGTQEEENDHE